MAVNPVTPTLNVGQSQTLIATPTTAGGRIVERNVSWTTSNAGVATVDANGVVTALAGGTAEITATAGGVSGSANVTVWHPVQSIVVSSGGVTTIKQEGSLQLSTTVTDATGAVVTGRQLEWISSDPAIAEVSTSGRVTGRTDGDVVITARTLGGAVQGTFNLNVNGPPDVATVTLTPTLGRFMSTGLTDQFVARAFAASGTELALTGRTVVWTSSVPANATVTDGVGGGLVSMLTDDGTSVINVTVDGIAPTAGVTVIGYPLLAAGAHVQPLIPLGESLFYIVDVPAGTATLRLQLTGDQNGGADADLIITRPNGTAGGTGFNAGTNEDVSISNPMAGRWRIEVNAWDGADDPSEGATLTITITPAT